MKCIYCGAEIKSELNNCPYCGTPIQMVPDYSIYDEDDINIILEGTVDLDKEDTPTEDQRKEQREARMRAKRKAEAEFAS